MIEDVTKLPDSGEYSEVLVREFTARYKDGRDPWSGEAAMCVAADLLLSEMPEAGYVLDAGTGRGHHAHRIASAGHRVLGADLVCTPEWDELARQCQGLAFTQSAILGLAAVGPFDAVLDNGCFHHQHPGSYATYLAKLHGMLHEGGLLVLLVYSAKGAAGRLYRNNDDRLHRQFTPAELDECVEPTGFRVTRRLEVERSLPGRFYLVTAYRRIP